MPRSPKTRTDDLLSSHPGNPYSYPTERTEEKNLQGNVPDGSVNLDDTVMDGTTYTRGAGEPHDAIVHRGTLAGTAGYSYRVFSTATYTIQAGDELHYDVLIDPASKDFRYALELRTNTPVANMRDQGQLDQNGVAVAPTTDLSSWAKGRWYHRKIPLAFWTGKEIDQWMSAHSQEGAAGTAGIHIGRLANVVIKNGTTIQFVAYSSGSATSLSVHAESNYSGVEVYSSDLSADAIRTLHLFAGAVTAVKISVSQLSAISADVGTLTAGIIRDAASKFSADLTNALLTVTDSQGSPVVRAKFGKVGAGATDYGIQVFDQGGKTIMDFTGAKRILAVPVQDQGSKSSTFTIDLSSGLTQQVKLAASALRCQFTGQVDGGRYRVWFQQDDTGSRTLPVFDDTIMFINDTPPVLSTAPGVFDVFEFEYRTNPTARFTLSIIAQNVVLPTPQVDSVTSTGVATVQVNHFVLMPAAVNAGDLLLMVIAFHAAQGTVTTPAGWTSFGTTGFMSVFAKVASGSEGGGNANVITANSVKAAAQVYRVHRWYGQISGIEAGLNSGAPGTSADPGSMTPAWGSDRNLWLAGVSTNTVPITDPANYGTFQQQDDGASTTRLRTGRRVLYAAAEDPAAFTWTGTHAWTALTIAIRPPA